MKRKSKEQINIRKLIAENIILRRKTAQRLRDYALYDLSKRNIRSIYANTEYLKILLKRLEELEKEYSLLCNILYNLEYKRS